MEQQKICSTDVSGDMPHYYDLHFNASHVKAAEPHWIVRRFGQRFEPKQLVMRTPGRVQVLNLSTVFQFLVVCVLGAILLAITVIAAWGFYNAFMGSYYRRAIYEQRLANTWMLDRVRESQGQLRVVEDRLVAMVEDLAMGGNTGSLASTQSVAIAQQISEARKSTTRSLGFAADAGSSIDAVATLGRKVSLADDQHRELTGKIADLEAALAREKSERVTISAERNDLNRRLADTEGALQNSQRALESAEANIAALEKRATSSETLLAADQNQIRQELASLTALVRQLELERDAGLQAVTLAQTKQRAAETQLASANALLADMRTQVAAGFEQQRKPLADKIEALEVAFARADIKAERYLPKDTPKMDYAGMGGPLELPPGSSDFASASEYDRAKATFYHVLPTLAMLEQRSTALKTIVDRLPFRSPVRGSRLTSRFGQRIDPISKKKKSFHYGIDFADKAGTPIHAAGAGKVIYAAPMGSFGNFVEIDHGYGFVSRYAHLKEIKVEKGETVPAGHVIGLMGNTGRSTGTHLHYEVRIGDERHNPLTFIKAAKHVF